MMLLLSLTPSSSRSSRSRVLPPRRHHQHGKPRPEIAKQATASDATVVYIVTELVFVGKVRGLASVSIVSTGCYQWINGHPQLRAWQRECKNSGDEAIT